MREKSLRLSPNADEVVGAAMETAASAVGARDAHQRIADPLGSQPSHVDTSLKETIVSITIAFVVAFVFRGFVVEPFLIPTGSMAPTLMGAHMRFTGPRTGYEWAVGPWLYLDPAGQLPAPIQRGLNGTPIIVNDPMSAEVLQYREVPRRAGDRIFVLKSLYSFFDPARFDVIVFKNPTNPQENYIKRLVGLPGEEIALVDGDVFARPAGSRAAGAPQGPGDWDEKGWAIAHKSERVQRSVWQPVFDSQYTPGDSLSAEGGGFRSPWAGDGAGWKIAGRNIYAFEGAGPTTLSWDHGVRQINDFYPYNQQQRGQGAIFPVCDVRVSFGIKPEKAGSKVALDLKARRHEFRAEIDAGRITLRMRPFVEGAEPGSWTTIGEGAMRGKLESGLRAGEFTDLEFWHVDQTLSVWADGEKLAEGSYGWLPGERVRNVLGIDVAEACSRRSMHPGGTSAFDDSRLYGRAEIGVEFDAGAFELARVRLDRDLHYQASPRTDKPASGTDPRNMPVLTKDQFFVCGDNSPASLDARLWTNIDPWVAEQIDDTVGVVHRDLLVGKAFFVYFPAPAPERKLWLPDFGRLRFIW